MPSSVSSPRGKRARPASPLSAAPAKSFFRVVSTEEARAALAHCATPTRISSAPVRDALGRVLGAAVSAPEDMPHFDRANMDGYAVRARDTFGASASVPAYLDLVGIVEMGAVARQPVARGQAVRISTGGMMPPGADAVVMIEYTDEVAGGVAPGKSSGRTVEIQRSVAPWENVLRKGEDIGKGTLIFPAGRRLRARDLGALAGIGVRRLRVHDLPEVALISTGDEIVAPEAKPRPGQVRNINAYSLIAMVGEAGAVTSDLGVIRDERDAMRTALASALDRSDVVILSGGSSVGAKDITLEIIQEFPRSEVVFHGISVAPGKPTILARALGKPILGLPGHPQSALVIFELFGAPLLRMMAGEAAATAFAPRRAVSARLGRNVASKPGREDYVRVRLETVAGVQVAQPMPAKSGAIFNLVQADGLVCVPANAEGLEQGAAVEVILL